MRFLTATSTFCPTAEAPDIDDHLELYGPDFKSATESQPHRHLISTITLD